MAQRELQRHEPAGGVTEDQRPLDAQRRAEGGDVVGHLLERARLERRRGGAALSAEVDEHELRVARQRAQAGSQVALVEAWAAVENDDRRAAARSSPSAIVSSGPSTSKYSSVWLTVMRMIRRCVAAAESSARI